MNIMLCRSRRFTMRPPATLISWRGRMNRKQAMDCRISSGGSGVLSANGVPGMGFRKLIGHHVRADFLQRERQVATVFAGFAHARGCRR